MGFIHIYTNYHQRFHATQLPLRWGKGFTVTQSSRVTQELLSPLAAEQPKYPESLNRGSRGEELYQAIAISSNLSTEAPWIRQDLGIASSHSLHLGGPGRAGKRGNLEVSNPWGYPQIIQNLDHFSIEAYGALGIIHYKCNKKFPIWANSNDLTDRSVMRNHPKTW